MHANNSSVLNGYIGEQGEEEVRESKVGEGEGNKESWERADKGKTPVN